ncbi:MAG: dihydrodipicolinate synthase family protein [Planctomycetota bacterium]
MLELQGVFPIVATPFTPEGEVDWAGFEQLCRVLAKGGCHGLTLFGIAGEFYKLADPERWRMAEIMIAVCRETGVKSIVSVTDHATEVAVQTAARIESMGADALMLLPPFFLKPGADAFEHHVREVGKRVSVPLVVQYAPDQTGVAIPPEMLASIANDLPTVQDFKIECKPPGHYISRLLDLTDRSVRIHVGNAGYNMIETFQRGAVGVMPGCSMFDLYLKINTALEAGDLDAALGLHTPLLEVLNHIRQNVEMIIALEKHILMRRGVIASDYCRRPTYAIDDHDRSLFEVLYERIAPHLDEVKG